MRVGVLLAAASMVLGSLCAQARPPAPVPNDTSALHAPAATRHEVTPALAGPPCVVEFYQLERAAPLVAISLVEAPATSAPAAYSPARAFHQLTDAAPGTAAPPEAGRTSEMLRQGSKVKPDPGRQRPVGDTVTDTKKIK